jgi:hypothetical protein
MRLARPDPIGGAADQTAMDAGPDSERIDELGLRDLRCGLRAHVDAALQRKLEISIAPPTKFPFSGEYWDGRSRRARTSADICERWGKPRIALVRLLVHRKTAHKKSNLYKALRDIRDSAPGSLALRPDCQNMFEDFPVNQHPH